MFTVSQVCVAIRRLHDLERPGVHWLLLLIPFYNIYLGFVLLLQKGTEGPNRYGEDPVAGHGAPVFGRVR